MSDTAPADQDYLYRGDEPIRVNKWLGQLGVCSRREAERLIADGHILINGETVEDVGRKIADGETLTLQGAGVEETAAKMTLILNKPVGFVSSQPEGEQIPAARLLTRRNAVHADETVPGKSQSLAPLGRLDQESRGLLLLSEDGVLAKAVIGPQSQLTKEYLVKVTGEITAKKLALLRHGLMLDERKLKPAKVTDEGGHTLRFILSEGRKRQIRRMCEAVELYVVDLLRIRVGPLELSDLPEGKWRHLSAAEREALLSAATASPAEKAKRPARRKQSRPNTRRRKSR